MGTGRRRRRQTWSSGRCLTVYLIKPGFSLSYIRKQNRVAKAHERDVLSLTSPVFRPCACGHAHAKRSATVLQAITNDSKQTHWTYNTFEDPPTC